MITPSKGMMAVALLLALAACETTASKDGAELADKSRAGRDSVRLDQDPLHGGGKTLAAAGIGDTVYFDYDKTTLREDGRPVLDAIAQWLKRYPNIHLRIAGHADERGTREYNLALGDRRALTVKNHLVAAGIAPDRLDTLSYGKERPAVVGSSEKSWAKNRRSVVEIE